MVEHEQCVGLCAYVYLCMSARTKEPRVQSVSRTDSDRRRSAKNIFATASAEKRRRSWVEMTHLALLNANSCPCGVCASVCVCNLYLLLCFCDALIFIWKALWLSSDHKQNVWQRQRQLLMCWGTQHACYITDNKVMCLTNNFTSTIDNRMCDSTSY